MPFKKGQSGNPKGRKPKDKSIHDFRRSSLKDFVDKMMKYGNFTQTQMHEELVRPDLTMFDSMYAQIVVRAAAGDKDARAVILERLLGKVHYQTASFINETSNDPLNPSASDDNFETERTEIIVYIPSNGREVGAS